MGQAPDTLQGIGRWWLSAKDGWQPYKVVECSAQAGKLVARLEGAADREGAAMLRGRQVAVEREVLPELAEGTHYWCDLQGLQVVNLQGEQLGEVTGLIDTGAHGVLVVRDGDGAREILIPCGGPALRSVNLPERRIVVDWQEDY